MSQKKSTPNNGCCGHRRQFLWESGAGFTGLALGSLLEADGLFSSKAEAVEAIEHNPLAPKVVHFPAKAKSCIFLFMYGGPSAVDTFDYKPELQKRDGQEIEIEIRRHKVKKQKLLASERKFSRHGESGLWCSDAFPHIARHMDNFV